MTRMLFNNNFKINQSLTDTYVGLTIEIWDKINFKFNENQKQNQTLLFQFSPFKFYP